MPSSFDSLYAAVALPSLQARLGQSITHNPAGVVADAVTITAIVDLDSERDLQGPQLEDTNGRRMILHTRIKIASSITVTYGPRPDQASTFDIDIGDGHGTSRWFAVREEGRDRSLQIVSIARIVKGTTWETRETRQ